jgi:hypothetical protein
MNSHMLVISSTSLHVEVLPLYTGPDKLHMHTLTPPPHARKVILISGDSMGTADIHEGRHCADGQQVPCTRCGSLWRVSRKFFNYLVVRTNCHIWISGKLFPSFKDTYYIGLALYLLLPSLHTVSCRGMCIQMRISQNDSFCLQYEVRQ